MMQFMLFCFAFISLVLIFTLQPETSQPGTRGIDKAKANGEKARFVLLNPLSSLSLMRSPNILLLVSETHYSVREQH